MSWAVLSAGQVLDWSILARHVRTPPSTRVFTAASLLSSVIISPEKYYNQTQKVCIYLQYGGSPTVDPALLFTATSFLWSELIHLPLKRTFCQAGLLKAIVNLSSYTKALLEYLNKHQNVKIIIKKLHCWVGYQATKLPTFNNQGYWNHKCSSHWCIFLRTFRSQAKPWNIHSFVFNDVNCQWSWCIPWQDHFRRNEGLSKIHIHMALSNAIAQKRKNQISQPFFSSRMVFNFM